MVGYSVGFSCVLDSLFTVVIIIASLSCVVCVWGAGDGVSCLGMLVMFMVSLDLKCSLVLGYTLPLTFIKNVLDGLGSIKDCARYSYVA